MGRRRRRSRWYQLVSKRALVTSEIALISFRSFKQLRRVSLRLISLGLHLANSIPVLPRFGQLLLTTSTLSAKGKLMNYSLFTSFFSLCTTGMKVMTMAMSPMSWAVGPTVKYAKCLSCSFSSIDPITSTAYTRLPTSRGLEWLRTAASGCSLFHCNTYNKRTMEFRNKQFASIATLAPL